MNNLDKSYQALLQDILNIGIIKEDRTGTGTLSVFGRQIRHKMSEGFPLLTTKKMAVKAMITELKWFLKGDTNIKYLVNNGCHIWDGDCYKAYIKRYNKGKYVVAKLLENSKKNRTLTEPLTPKQLKELGLSINVDVSDCKNFKEASKVQEQIINGDVKINIIKK